MSDRLLFVPLEAAAFFAIELQDSQRSQYGMDPLALGVDEAQLYADQRNAWMALRGDRVVAILGINETFEGVQGVAFALLGRDLGRDHVAVTRFARDVVIGQSKLQRIEAIVRAPDLWAIEDAPEHLRARKPAHMLELALQRPTPEIRWALAVGLEPAAVLRKFGFAGETHMLMEKIAA